MKDVHKRRQNEVMGKGQTAKEEVDKERIARDR